ncbi:MDIS1-interacting receptor like kinase 2-like [Ziziphus jujuba]|uniref:non-specific serine/threonine protein kinase n=1 Tax=Ziziphus jujuba TaxID=326968 RepID=A0ABM4A5G8_ZIZJJ|nr:MDIS1-interacting receptor like kinase 2-like [Ziziphus jujuba]
MKSMAPWFPNLVVRLPDQFLLLFIIILLFLCSSTTCFAISGEAEALVKWKDSLDMNPTTHSLLRSWNLNSTVSTSHRLYNNTPCNWVGITCNGFGSVINITLYSSNLKDNKLGGPFPKHLERCANLENLNLRSNRFNGAVPFQIGNFHSLRNVDLSRNMLIGDLPPELGNLFLLETLNLSHNNFIGSIPASFQKLVSLTSVDVSYNQLEGPLPHIKAFIEAPLEALEDNKGLCGNNTSLKPCPTPKDKNRNQAVIAIVVSISSILFLLFIIVGIVFIYKRRVRNMDEPREIQTEAFFAAWNHDGKKVHEEIVEATENFDSKYCIGVGGNGSVYKTLLSTGQLVAVKKFHENDGIDHQQAFKSETSILPKVRHRNIIKLFGFCSHTRYSFLVYEFMELGSLVKILSDNEKATELEWFKRVNIVKGLAKATSYLHHECFPAIVHRDISSKNVLLDDECEAHISDFGSATTLDPVSSNWTPFAGTLGYSAPGRYSIKVPSKFKSTNSFFDLFGNQEMSCFSFRQKNII